MDPIRKIVIVGGGTAGWISALVLQRALRAGSGCGIEITLIESTDIGTIGVGESTVPTLRTTLRYAGIDEDEFLARCNATFKLGIRFVNWTRGADEYWHPFGPVPDVRGSEFSILRHWVRARAAGFEESFDRACFSGSVQAAVARKAAKTLDDPPYESRLAYAYHVDAGLLATFLREKATQRGVRHVVDLVLDTRRDGRGFITHLETKGRGAVAGDLFVDCSGFQGFLINRALGEPFESYADLLLCDSALALAVPMSEDDHVRDTFTTATALTAGWAWRVPLQSRTGNGYVHSSAFLSKDQAVEEFVRYLGPRAVTLEPRYIKMRVGRTRRAWVNNCVSIGLSAGFIEPLESTAIFLIEHGIGEFILRFPDRAFDSRLRDHYNATMERVYVNIRDFVLLHYVLTQREDGPFWRANRHHAAVPPTLRAVLDNYEAGILPRHDPNHWGFNEFSHMAILAGMGRLPRRADPIMDYQDPRVTEWGFEAARADAAALLRTLPEHHDYLAAVRERHVPALARATL